MVWFSSIAESTSTIAFIKTKRMPIACNVKKASSNQAVIWCVHVNMINWAAEWLKSWIMGAEGCILRGQDTRTEEDGHRWRKL
jgi:hypothetical protein